MKRKRRAPAVITALMLALALAASCSPDSVLPTETASPPPTDTLPPTEPPTAPPPTPRPLPDTARHVTLNLSVFYDTNATMQYRAIEGNYNPTAEYHAADGKTYRSGDFKPIWSELQKRLNFTIKDVHPLEATNVNQSFQLIFADNFSDVDIVVGNATQIVSTALTNGTFVALDQYLDIMPNFSKFLDDYSVVKTSITAADGHIYYAPYFDGFDDIERMFIFRADWVRRLLDEDAAFDTDREVDTYYKPYIDAPYDFTVQAVTADGGGVQTIRKKAGENVITTQNNLEVKNGATLTTALRAHIDAVYGNTYKNRSDLFIGQDAAYDADEMVALFRCVLANTSFLTGQSERPAVPFYPRWYQMGRVIDMFALFQGWGVRGTESKMGHLYIDANGNMREMSLEKNSVDAVERMHWMYKEGLILKDFDTSGATEGLLGGDHRARLNNENLGFATYDYAESTAAFNKSVPQKVQDTGFDLRPVLPPVANWDGEWHQFTPSWRSVKSDGWAILKSIEADSDKLYRALTLFDYMFSTEGGRLMSYGP
ncbi:MAG: hypothetical protein LBR85_08305, partial [Oscillospiraceae bacterium]|nr:hypothetical protein [Oscillospiraceae bacterium]